MWVFLLHPPPGLLSCPERCSLRGGDQMLASPLLVSGLLLGEDRNAGRMPDESLGKFDWVGHLKF